MICSSCGADVRDNTCPRCGAAVPAAAPTPSARVETDVPLRAGAFLIDVVPAALAIFAIAWIPIVGTVLLGIVLLDYWLLRDIMGASLGKLVLKLRVVDREGSESDAKARILRNVPLAIGPALLIIPSFSSVIAPAAVGCFALMEAVLLVVKKQRLGDLMAGTTVVSRKEARPLGTAGM